VSGVDELVAFLRAALDRDEQVAMGAQAAAPGQWRRTDEGALWSTDTGGNGYFATGPWDTGIGDQISEHMLHWDPARVLAEVKAKRQLLDLHSPGRSYREDELPVCGSCRKDRVYPCRVVRLLAQPYAGQPGWREEWQLSAPT
jgi:hypothetical protein